MLDAGLARPATGQPFAGAYGGVLLGGAHRFAVLGVTGGGLLCLELWPETVQIGGPFHSAPGRYSEIGSEGESLIAPCESVASGPRRQ